jgi:uncharacterized protein (TIGR03437 family)
MWWRCLTLVLWACLGRAGTTVIHVDTECCGDVVDTAKNVVNRKGAIFWNGTKWVTNDTAAHMYFTDLRTGERLKNYVTTQFLGSSTPATATHQNYTVERTLYTYEKSGAGGKYSFTAAQFRITDTSRGKQYLARSRGTGAGKVNAYFDIYLTDEDGKISAVRGDPAWFNYALSLDQAVLQTSATANKLGEFPTVGGNYFFDIDGGSDMGGRSFQFHTSALAVADPALGWGPSFATDFSVKYMDTASTLQELKFLPYAEGTYTPNNPNLPVIAGVISAGAFGGFTSIAPGSWIEIYGARLASTSRAWAGEDFNGVKAPTSLSATKVSIGGKDAVLSYISPGQVNAQVPAGVATAQQSIIVSTSAGASPAYAVTVNARQPGLFAHPAFTIAGRQHIGAVYANDGNTFVMPVGAVAGIASRPARPGETILLFGIGFGAATPGAWSGEIAQQQSELTEPVTMYVNQSKATLLYAGLVPGAVGLYQFNLVVPTVAASDAVPLTFSQGNVAGTQTLYIAIGK